MMVTGGRSDRSSAAMIRVGRLMWVKKPCEKTAPLFAQSRAVGLQCIVNPHARPAILLLKLHGQAKGIQSNERWFAPLPATGRFKEALASMYWRVSCPRRFLDHP
jgi:hypothetical protein